MSQKPRKPKVKDRVVSEGRLLDAAEEVFSKHGFAGATTREIAKRAGINLALIARYFDGKYGLLIAVLQRKMDMFDKEQVCYENYSCLTDEYQAYVKLKFEQMTGDLDFIKVVIGGFLTDEKFLKRFQEILPSASKHPELVERVEHYRAKGKLKPDAVSQEIVDNVEKAMMSAMLFDLILSKKPKEEVLSDLLRFTKTYVGCFEK